MLCCIFGIIDDIEYVYFDPIPWRRYRDCRIMYDAAVFSTNRKESVYGMNIECIGLGRMYRCIKYGRRSKKYDGSYSYDLCRCIFGLREQCTGSSNCRDSSGRYQRVPGNRFILTYSMDCLTDTCPLNEWGGAVHYPPDSLNKLSTTVMVYKYGYYYT